MEEFSKEYVCPNCRSIKWKKGKPLTVDEAVSKGGSF
jgi:hypothetical protein